MDAKVGPGHFFSGVFWSFVQALAARFITGAGFLVIGWFVGPEEFGRFALVSIFLMFAEVVCEQIWSQALVQSPQDESQVAELVFRRALGLGVAISLGALLLVDPLAGMYAWQDQASMLQLAALCPVMIGLCAAPTGLAKRRLDFKSLAVRTVWASGISTALGIALAATGWGATGLVVQQLAYWLISAVVLWGSCTWRPSMRRRVGRLHGLHHLLGANLGIKLADIVESRGIELVVGALAGMTALGYYAFASKIAQIVFVLLASPIVEVVLASAAKTSSAADGGDEALRRGALLASLLATPALIFAIVAGGPVLTAVYGVKWAGAVLPLQLLLAAQIVKAYSSLSGAFLIGCSRLGAALRVSLSRTAVVLLVGWAGLALGPRPETAALVVLLGALQGWWLGVQYSARVLNARRSVVASPGIKAMLVATAMATPGIALWHAGGHVLGVLAAAGAALVAAALLWLLNAGAIARQLDGKNGRMAALRRAALTLLLWRDRLALRVFAAQLRLALALTPRNPHPPRHQFIVPADTRDPDGSLGDQALLCGLVALLDDDQTEPLIAGSHDGRILAVRGAALWSGRMAGWRFGRAAARRAAAVYVIGADVMDGFYAEAVSRRRIAVAQAMARAGIPCAIAGFSFNETPSPAVCRDFARLHPAVHLSCRDVDSLQRFEAFTGRRACLSADLAFLAPVAEHSAVGDLVAAWAAQQRAAGRRIVGLNVNPHVVAHLGSEAEAELADRVASACRELVAAGVALVLVPHDFRIGCADLRLLDRVAQQLADVSRSCVLVLRERFNAIEIKAACREMDLVFSGRMHLAIGALTAGTPACGMAYQGKFSGLFKHFGFASGLIVTPEKVMREPHALAVFLLALLERSDELRRQVGERLPAVRALASNNRIPASAACAASADGRRNPP